MQLAALTSQMNGELAVRKGAEEAKSEYLAINFVKTLRKK